MQTVLLSQIPWEQIKSELSEIVKAELQKLSAPAEIQSKENTLLTRKQTATLLGISLPTLNEWTKSGEVTAYRIGASVRYKKAEVEQSLSEIKYSRR